jgi:hypothetical protein
MNNHWLNALQDKKLFKSIVDKLTECMANQDSFATFIVMLNEEESDLFLSMRVSGLVIDWTDRQLEVGLESK